jgi:hypothetical protein
MSEEVKQGGVGQFLVREKAPTWQTADGVNGRVIAMKMANARVRGAPSARGGLEAACHL